MPTVTTHDECWICGENGAVPERTLLGFKRPICPPEQGCSARLAKPVKHPGNRAVKHLDKGSMASMAEAVRRWWHGSQHR